MRSTFRSTVLAAIAVLALGAFASASASAALPEFVPANGKFPVKFTAGGTEMWLESSNHRITCTSEATIGEITGPKTVKATVYYKSCMETPFKQACWNGESSAKQITTAPLVGRIGYINKTTKQVGLQLEGEKHKEFEDPRWDAFQCGGETHISVNGEPIAPLSPVNSQLTSFSFPAHQKNGSQEIKKLEGGLEGYPYQLSLKWTETSASEALGLEYGSRTLTTLASAEIKA